MEVIGYIASIFIGITLGLIGGGGSILTVPVLVYLFSVEAVPAAAYSMFIVGLTSIVGSYSYFRNGLVHFKTALIFGIPSIIAVYLTRAFVVPAIPSEIFTLGSFVLTKGVFLMLLFAFLMIAASYNMIKSNKNGHGIADSSHKIYYPVLMIQGAIVGGLTSLVGAGGGFLIIPALVLLSKLHMKEAIGTSLLIIAINSTIGFLSESSSTYFDWKLLLSVSGFAIFGIIIGLMLSKKIEGSKLKPAFGWFVLLMGVYIIIKETILK
ncbi:MAG: sulfite exporter TauE/SafE family protein [Saprospiraceae bacterium]|nr:sulfite exporter TauE/SafE family protein [Saprospiraceae bacterium]